MEEKFIELSSNKEEADVSDTGNHGEVNGSGRFKGYFTEYCQNSSINGFKYLAEKRTILEKITWLFLIILSFGICTFFILKVYFKFEENPFIVTLDTKMSSIHRIPFPAVTVCPMSKAIPTKVNFTYLVHKLWDNETLDDVEIRNAQYMSLICGFNNDRISKILPQLNTITEEVYNHIHEYRLSIQNLSLCSFLGRGYGSCSKYFTPIILDEGKCYTFNMLDREDIFRENVFHFQDYHQSKQKSTWTIEKGYPKNSRDVYPKRSFLAGPDNALEIFLAEIDNYSDYLCSDIIQGFKVMVHTPHSIHQLRKNYFIVPLDTSVTSSVKPSVMLTSRQVEKYSVDKRQCYFGDERYLRFFKIYTRENCKLECLTNHTFERCGCVNYYMPRLPSTPICGNGKMTCMADADLELKEIELDGTDGDTNEEKCHCLPLCTDITFDSTETILPMNWKAIFKANKFDNGFTRLGMETNMRVSKLTVYFSSDQFIASQRNELYGPFDFLANFGGLLGLFTGFSLLSLAEIIYYLSLRLWCNFFIYNNVTG